MSEHSGEGVPISMPCMNCQKGVRTAFRKDPEGEVTNFSYPCPTCSGTGHVMRNVPTACQITGCSQPAHHQCTGPICNDIWVCSSHWMAEDIGFSQAGYACEICWHEVGSGGH